MKILALDVCITSVKAAILDVASAAPIGPIARFRCELDHPTQDAAEVPPERLWATTTAAAREATRGVEGVEAIGLSCLAPALVLLDKGDRPLGPLWTPLDRRARPAARQTWAAVGEEFLRTTG